MSLVRLEKVSKSFSGSPVLDQVDFRVEEGEKIGLIGRNGTGKSTLFRLITGEVVPDSGVVERMKRARVAYLAQIPEVPAAKTLFDVVMQRFEDLFEMEERLRGLEQRMGEGDEATLHAYSELEEQFSLRGGYEFRLKVKRVLTGLGFKEEEFDLPFKALSGGQRTRLMLALVLLEEADLLLLDEPENHLDLEAREWLEGFLKEWRKAFVIISHDRRMLNEVVGRTVEVERRELRGFSGNYEAYLKDKALLREDQEKSYRRQQEFIEREESWINRFRYKNTKARQVQSRIKRLEKLERIEAPEKLSATAKFSLGEVVRSGQTVLEAEGLSMAYGSLVLYDDVSFRVQRGERVGVIGPNGSGKTTLLRHLAGRIEGKAGTVTLGHKTVLGYYDQQLEDLSADHDILTEVARARPSMLREQLRTFLGRFLFRGDDVFKSLSALSGGERSRVAVAKLVLGDANVLLLDEPTNHLDLASREALEGALADFPGSMVVVSHDRALIDRLVDKLIVISDGRASVHLGNYSDYRWKQDHGGVADGAAAADIIGAGAESMKIRKKQPREASQRKLKEKEFRKQRKRMDELENTIHQVEELIEDLEKRFAETPPSDYAALGSQKEEYEGLKGDLAELYSEWEDLSETLSRGERQNH